MAKETNKSNKENKEKNSFFKEFKAELKRVSWPTFKQLVNNTGAVIAIVLIVAVIVFVLDVAFENLNKEHLPELTQLEDGVDVMKKQIITNHFERLAEGNCTLEGSPYFSSVIVGLERVADHLVNVGYSIKNPTGSQNY